MDEVEGTSYRVGEDRSEVRLDLQVLLYIFLGNYVSLRDLRYIYIERERERETETETERECITKSKHVF